MGKLYSLTFLVNNDKVSTRADKSKDICGDFVSIPTSVTNSESDCFAELIDPEGTSSTYDQRNIRLQSFRRSTPIIRPSNLS
jgi:hypothetical protein